MKISIIMPSYLGEYKGAASNRETKILRAIDSVINQTYEDWELYIVADGCRKTFDIVENRYSGHPKIEMSLINKQPLWSGKVRNFGIEHCTGEWVCYCDTDDFLGKNHLQIIANNTFEHDWLFFDDMVLRSNRELQFNVDTNAFHQRKCHPNKQGQNGTSNIAHKKSLGVLWKDETYLHDFKFLQELKAKSKNWAFIKGGEYHVCHLPDLKNKKGFDV